MSHGVYKSEKSPFAVVHASQGSITLGESFLIGQPGASSITEPATNSSYLFKRLCESTVLNSSVVSPKELLLKQLEKLTINAVINPLTVIFDCRNGELIKHMRSRALMEALVAEDAAIIQSLLQTSLGDSISPARTDLNRFTSEILWEMVWRTAIMVRENTSSMLQDVRTGSPTEIDYINGYLVAQAECVGVDCVLNRALVQLVKGGRKISIDDGVISSDRMILPT